MSLFWDNSKQPKEPVRYICKECGQGYDNRQEAIECHPNISEVDFAVDNFLDQLVATFDQAEWEITTILGKEISVKIKLVLSSGNPTCQIVLSPLLFTDTLKHYYESKNEAALLKIYHDALVVSSIGVLLENGMQEYIPVLKRG